MLNLGVKGHQSVRIEFSIAETYKSVAYGGVTGKVVDSLGSPRFT